MQKENKIEEMRNRFDELLEKAHEYIDIEILIEHGLSEEETKEFWDLHSKL